MWECVAWSRGSLNINKKNLLARLQIRRRNIRTLFHAGGTLLQCPQSSDVIAFRSSCFRIFTFRASWAEARTFCRSMQHLNHRWDLASLTDYRSTRRIISALESYNSRMQGTHHFTHVLATSTNFYKFCK